jgi:hypothetical protein
MAAVIEPDAPLSSEERAMLAQIGERSLCTRRWLERFLPVHRYYVAIGTVGCQPLAYRRNAFGPMIVLRLKDGARLSEWRARRWALFDETPQILEATLITLHLIEQIVSRPHEPPHIRGHMNAGALTVTAHGPESEADIPLWPQGDSDLPPKLRAGDSPCPCSNQVTYPFSVYAPPGCVVEN